MPAAEPVDADVSPTDLNAFQRDLLAAAASHDDEPSGQDLAATLELAFDYDDVAPGQLYPSLEKLVRLGLVERGRIDGRTNSHAVTDAGEALLIAHFRTLSDALHGVGGEP